jgi:signal transduction histidine kinase
MMPAPARERPLALAELLPARECDRLARALTALVDADVRIVDCDGRTLCGSAREGIAGEFAARQRIVLEWELDPVGYLEIAGGTPERAALAVEWLTMLMKATARYRMASDLHHVAIEADYEALQQQHAALVDSEQRYRALATQLEERVAEQVKAIEHTQRSLYQSGKLASVGQLAAGMAHEINNPIGFMRSNLGSARGYLEELRGQPGAAAQAVLLEDFDALLQECIDGADRIARIVADLKMFSRVDQGGRRDCDLNQVVRSACAVLAPQLPAAVQVELELADLPACGGDPAGLGEAVFNLAQNAAQAIDGSGTITIGTARDADCIALEIADTGRGMPEAVQSRIFDPFFTTRPVGQGTGLGLTVARDVVTACRGTIHVQSREGQGTCVRILLPVADSAREAE